MDKTEFFKSVLRALGITPTQNGLAFLIEWARHENTKAVYNPLATTKTLGRGEDNFNRAGVKNYRTLEDGITATAKTLALGYYKPIIAMLKEDRNFRTVKDEKIYKALNTWGTVNFAKRFKPVSGGGGLITPLVILLIIGLLLYGSH